MAAFHYKLEVIPRWYAGDPPMVSIPVSVVDEGVDPWGGFPPPSNRFINELRSLLPVDKSWGETEEYISTNEMPSDLRIWRDGSNIFSIEFRFNPYSDAWSLMQRFLAIVKDEDYLLLESRTGMLLLPDEGVINARNGATNSKWKSKD